MARVVKVARRGFDVQTAGDENLLYSSLWPVLSIYKEIPVNLSKSDDVEIIAEHGLGYPPMFLPFVDYSGATTSPGAATLGGPFQVSDKYVRIDSLGYNFTRLKGVIYLYTLDLSTPYTAPIVNLGGLPGLQSSDKVFKLAKVGKSIHSTQLKDFVITTDARSPLIHSVTPGIVQGGELVAEHNLGYVPLFFGYSRQNPFTGENYEYYQLMNTGGGGDVKFSSSTAQVKLKGPASGLLSINGLGASIVVLKDPFDATLGGIVTI